MEPGPRAVRYPFADPVRLEVDDGYRQCRERGGLTRVAAPFGDQAWLATTHADIRLVLGDPRFSRAAAARHDEARLTPLPLQASLLGADPPDHTRMRGLLASALRFTGPRVAAMRPSLERTADALLAGGVDAGPPFDLAEGFTTPLSVSAACDLMGVPLGDQEVFREWFESFASTELPAAEVEERVARISRYTRDLLADRRARPRDDLVSVLAGSRSLTERELVEVVEDLFLAGDNVATQLTNALYVLLTSPEHWQALLRDPGLLPGAVEELLRFVPFPSHATFARYALEDVRVGGSLVRAGEAVLPALPSGNRDESVFADPDRLDFHRSPNPHLAFGHGRHHCLGSKLVRELLAVAIGRVQHRLPGARLAVPVEDVRWRADMLIRRVVRLPVTWSVVR
ncbi:cytochrome P450 [Saccharothrix obliqua]|uniref:cytochrome P450 n=1 Tax=Saccharothrix obliqua TaxID=2861747 RepID=UPI001C5D87D8|nr:cytochrome P450 [Saccharothrix obliqua]MBW4717837.1 cytochrome P450 [Saccharothrix obliqua]